MLLMDIVTFNSYEKSNNTKKTNNNFFDYVYLETGEKLLKFKITIDNYMHLINILENYILNMKVDEFSIVNEKELQNMKTVPKQFLPYLGKYAIAGELQKTEHYYVPKTKELLELLIDLYDKADKNKELTLTATDLNDLTQIIKNTRDYNDIRSIDQILGCITIKLEDEFVFNSETLKSEVTTIRKLTGNDNIKDLIQRIYHIQSLSKSNIENIKFLRLEDKFVEATKIERQKVK